MSKQTAVEWLIEQLNYLQSTKNERSLILQLDLYEEYCEEAKAMEKEQLENAYFNGGADNMNDEGSFKEYYNKTYGGDE
jgi:hypothetical protein